MNDFDNNNGFNNQNNNQNNDQEQNNSWSNINYDNGFSEPKEEHTFYSAPDNGNSNKPPKKSNTGLKVFASIICVVFIVTVVAFTGYVVYKEGMSDGNGQTQSEADVSSKDQTSLNIQDTPDEESKAQTTSGELDSTEIAKKVTPSVVGIMVYMKNPQTQNYQQYAIGSGVIMSSDGYIITNAHVVMLEDRITPVDKLEVYLDNGETAVARIVGADVKTDLAVIKIEKDNLVAAEFGDSAKLQVGEKAVVIGNPKSLTFLGSFSQGVISGVNREIAPDNSGYTIKCIQTDASINPGNSGGALINKYGQVIGINSSKIAGENFEGMGFAIPINEAKPVLESLIENGYVSNRVRIGITFTSINEGLAEISGVPTGLRVVIVDPTVDAYAKGVTPGDIITHIDGQPVLTLKDVSTILKTKAPGESVKLTIYRGTQAQNQTLEIDVILQEDTSSRVAVE